MMYVTVSTWTRCSVCLCLQLFVGGIFAYVLFTLFVFVCMWWCPTRVVLCLCFVFLCLVYPVLPIFDFPFGVLWRLFFNILVVYTAVNQVHNGNFVCLWIENKHSMSIVYRESLTSSDWSNGWHIHSCTPISLTDHLTGIS